MGRSPRTDAAVAPVAEGVPDTEPFTRPVPLIRIKRLLASIASADAFRRSKASLASLFFESLAKNHFSPLLAHLSLSSSASIFCGSIERTCSLLGKISLARMCSATDATRREYSSVLWSVLILSLTLLQTSVATAFPISLALAAMTSPMPYTEANVCWLVVQIEYISV